MILCNMTCFAYNTKDMKEAHSLLSQASYWVSRGFLDGVDHITMDDTIYSDISMYPTLLSDKLVVTRSSDFSIQIPCHSSTS